MDGRHGDIDRSCRAREVKLLKLGLPDAVNPAPRSEIGKPHRQSRDT